MSKFTDYIKIRKKVEARLSVLGITESQYMEIFNDLDSITRYDLETVRQSQFDDDAYSLAIDIQSATNKKQQQIAAYLRQFAEHIVSHAAPEKSQEQVKSIVDALPQMCKEEDEE